jgi:hypothetical protein
MRRPDLVPDCGSCDALCCVATPFDASEDFAISKAAGAACPHLASDHRCTIHESRIERGFLGCTIYDCYGAGPEITRRFAGCRSHQLQRDAAFMALRVVHELLWQLLEASKLCPASDEPLASALRLQLEKLEELARLPTPALLAADLEPNERAARALLKRLGKALTNRPSKRLPMLPAAPRSAHAPTAAPPSARQNALHRRRSALR